MAEEAECFEPAMNWPYASDPPDGRAGESKMLDLFHTARSFAETCCPWLESPPNKASADLSFRLWQEPAGCWLKWSGQSA